MHDEHQRLTRDEVQRRVREGIKAVLGEVMEEEVTFPLLRRIHIYGAYYHEKVNKGMLRQKAKVAVMRIFLCMVYALARSGAGFDAERFRTCESKYHHRHTGRRAA